MKKLLLACLLLAPVGAEATGDLASAQLEAPEPDKTSDFDLVVLEKMIAKGELEQSVSLLKDRLAAQPDDHQARMTLGDVYLTQSKYQHALNAYSQVLLKDKNVPRAASGRARALVGLGDAPKAIKWAKKATEMAPDDLWAWEVLGLVYLHEKYLDAPRAEATFRQMLVLDPKSRSARLHLARALSYQKKIDLAIEQLESLTSERPLDWPVQIKLAESYYAIRKLSKARSILVKVLAAQPDNKDARRVLTAVEGRQTYNFWVPVGALIALPVLFLLFVRLKRGKVLKA